MPKPPRLITDFFKPKPKKLITDYFKPKYRAKTVKMPGIYIYNTKLHYQKSRHYLNQHKQQTDVAGTRDGYFFCATNNFSEYRVNTTIDRCVVTDNIIQIIQAGTRVATATIDDDSALEHIEVEPMFRRQGVGKSLIRFINKHDTQFHVYAGTEHNSRYRLTEEGAALIRACQREGILNDEQVILGDVPPSPSLG